VKAFGIFLLLSFSMVLIPKNWWHHCAHTEHQKLLKQSTDTIDEDCPICDLSLSVFTSPNLPIFYFQKHPPLVRDCAIMNNHPRALSTLFQLRAPPKKSA